MDNLTPEQRKAIVEVDATLRIYLETPRRQHRIARYVRTDLALLREAFPQVELPEVPE